MKNTDRLQEIMTLARRARDRAYTPYSGFRMGAAVDTEKGLLLPGSLVENVSLGLAMCAERVALFSTIAQGAGQPITLVVVAERTNGRFTLPCGACLQVALELGGPELRVVACDPKGKNEATRLGDLAPRLPYKGTQRAYEYHR